MNKLLKEFGNFSIEYSNQYSNISFEEKFFEFVRCSSRFISFKVDGRLPDNKLMIPSKIKRLMQNITSKILKMLIPHDNPNIPPRREIYY